MKEVEILSVHGNKVMIAFNDGSKKEISVDNYIELGEKCSFIWFDNDTVLADFVDGKLINLR